jgi:hypothetical protein
MPLPVVAHRNRIKQIVKPHTESTGSTGSGVVEAVFDDYFASQRLETEPTAFDGRSDYDPCYHEACDTFDSVFAFPPGLPELDGNGAKGLDEMVDGGAHAVLTFAQTSSAVQGTDKGEANGQYKPEYQGSALRR